MSKAINVVGLALIALAFWLQFGGGVPDLIPQPVESPFPDDKFYLFAASESAELSGVEVAISAKDIRDIVGEGRRWGDYDKTYEEPWNGAKVWCFEKSGGTPYFVARNGNKADEGKLEGTIEEKHARLMQAVEELR